MNGTLRWHVHDSADALAAAVAGGIGEAASKSIAARGRFVIVLAGGSTPLAAYRRARDLITDWDRWHVYFSDERCVPAHSDGRNDHMARDAWLNHVAIPCAQIHPIPAERGPEAGAEAYRRTLVNVGRFDLTLLGIGEDGHTASLFPGDDRAALEAVGAAQTSDVIGVHTAPKSPSERVSLSAARLAATHGCLFLAQGADKRDALRQLRDGRNIPARLAVPEAGADVHIDRDSNPDPVGRPASRI